MTEASLLTQLLLLIAIATLGAAAFERLRLPAVAGFLVTGALVGPGGLGLIAEPDQVRALAELGVVFLLFEIGLELPLERVRRMWRRAVLAGALQVAATLALVATAAAALGVETRGALVLGALVAMSSTALVMRMLSERGEIDAPHGQLAVGILLFQDLCIVPFLVALPILASEAPAWSLPVALQLVRASAALALLVVLARFLLPRLLERAARASREIFTMVAFLVVFGSAVVAEEIGLTLSVGAFVGGLVLSASPYAPQLFAEVVPLRGILLGIFFTAVGMLLDPVAALEVWPGVLAYVSGVVLIKAGFVAAIVAYALRQGLRLGVITGLTLAQTGEFSFVLAAAAGGFGLIGDDLQQTFVAGSVGTLLATPFLIRVAPRVAAWLAGRADREPIAEDVAPKLSGHVVLIGLGLAGRTLARILRARRIAYVALEANALSVQEARSRGEPVIYGDATRPVLLERLGVARARLVVVAISDPVATREVVALVRSLSREVPIVARARYVLEVDGLQASGVSVVVAEEFESTLELVAETLRRFGMPQTSIARFTAELREEGYEPLRAPPAAILDPWLAELLEEVATEWVEVPDAFGEGASLGELGVRNRTGANVVAVERAGTATPTPGAEFDVRPGDRLLVVGTPEAVKSLRSLVSGPFARS